MTARSKRVLQVVSCLGLGMSILPAALLFAGIVSKDVYLNLMVLGMVLWFSTAVCWIRPDHANQ